MINKNIIRQEINESCDKISTDIFSNINYPCLIDIDQYLYGLTEAVFNECKVSKRNILLFQIQNIIYI